MKFKQIAVLEMLMKMTIYMCKTIITKSNKTGKWYIFKDFLFKIQFVYVLQE